MADKKPDLIIFTPSHEPKHYAFCSDENLTVQYLRKLPPEEHTLVPIPGEP